MCDEWNEKWSICDKSCRWFGKWFEDHRLLIRQTDAWCNELSEEERTIPSRMVSIYKQRETDDAMSWVMRRGPFHPFGCRFKNRERQMMQWAESWGEDHSIPFGVDLKTVRDRWCNELSQEERTIPSLLVSILKQWETDDAMSWVKKRGPFPPF
jgi:hypothetical protein